MFKEDFVRYSLGGVYKWLVCAKFIKIIENVEQTSKQGLTARK